FCDGSSQQIVNLLLKECANTGVDIRVNCAVTSIRKDGRFSLGTNAGDLEAHSLVIATGGLSIPRIGATDFGYRIARQFGIKVSEVRPALVPLTLGGDEGRSLRELSGVSFEADVSSGGTSFRENVLLTHHGLSGPAVLQISSYWKPGEAIVVV